MYSSILGSMLTARRIVVVLLIGLFFSLFDYELALGQRQPQQQSFLTFNNPNLGVTIQYPSDWELQKESNDKLRFIKQEGFVTADLNVEDLDRSQSNPSEYANTRINELRTQRPEFQLISTEPITLSNKPAQKVVYTFEREEDGKTNKVMRIWSTNEDKLYTLAYIAESGQYDRYLPMFQSMVDSFDIGTGSTTPGSTTQIQTSDGSREDNNGIGNCDRISYPDPDICIPPYSPDLNCPDITYSNFRVTGPDPHGFDRDKDGIGCESTDGGGVTPPDNGDGTPPNGGDGNCDPSYPDVCIKSPPPDLNCPDIPNKNFKVIGNDPHGLDRDSDGIGCESADGGNTPTPGPGIGDSCVEVDGYLLSEGSYLDERKRIVGSPCNPEEFCSDVGSTDPTVRDHCSDIWLDFDCDDPGMVNDPRCLNGDRHPCYPDPTTPECLALTPTPTPTDYCYLPGIGDWWDNPDCKDYLEDKYKNRTPPPSPSPPSLSPPCPPDAEGIEVCPPTDEPTPVPEPPTPCPPDAPESEVCPPTDDITPVPEPPQPDCPEAGPDVCGEEPPPEEVPPDSNGNGNGNGNDGNDDGNGEDGSSGNGDNGGGEEGGGTVPPFG
jgi:hypothetical protein